MNENAKKWVKALRSREYDQGREWLQTADGKYCCLGVACDVYEKETGITLPKNRKGCFSCTDESLSDEYGCVREWLGLKTEDGRGDPVLEDNSFLVESYSSLMSVNDSGDYDFQDIANIIEAKQDSLFIKTEEKE